MLLVDAAVVAQDGASNRGLSKDLRGKGGVVEWCGGRRMRCEAAKGNSFCVSRDGKARAGCAMTRGVGAYGRNQ